MATTTARHYRRSDSEHKADQEAAEYFGESVADVVRRSLDRYQKRYQQALAGEPRPIQQLDHSGCSHPSTPAARKQCRERYYAEKANDGG